MLTHKHNYLDDNHKYTLNEQGKESKKCCNIIEKEMLFEANPQLNMATFVTTEMEPEATKLMQESINKNFIDKPIYPQTLELQKRCVSILSNLFHSEQDGTGVAAVGSSEAIHLAGLTMKWNWKKWYRNKFSSEPTKKPNIIMGSNVQVCWKKFCKYFEVELIDLPVTENHTLDMDKTLAAIDENTIGVVGILGNTYSGEFDDIEKLNEGIEKINQKKDFSIWIHVDAASGGFVAPFSDIHKGLVWDFRLKNVKSINVSGHKYGLVYPGIGWALWRSKKIIDEDLIFQVKYLGQNQEDFGLNFSRGSSQIIGQYYNFIRYGRKGYQEIINQLIEDTQQLTDELESFQFDNQKVFIIESHKSGLPLVAASLTKALQERMSLEDIAHKIKERGWVLPVYPLSSPKSDTMIMRIVVRKGFDEIMIEKLINDLQWSIEQIREKSVHSYHPDSHVIC